MGGVCLAGARPAARGARLNHQAFVAAERQGRQRVQIDREAAARFVAGRAMLPLVLLPILGLGVALALVGYVWSGIAVFLIGILIRFLVKRSSDGFLLWRALRDEQFYRQVLAAQVLKIDGAA